MGSLFAELVSLKKQAEEIVESVPESTPEPEPVVEELVEKVFTEPPTEPIPASEIHSKTEIDKYLTGKSFQQPDPDKVDPNLKAIQDKMKFLEQAIGRIAATGAGSGEVNFRYLDDVDRSTIGPNKHLAYNPDTKKFFFEEVTSSEPQVQSDWNVTDNISPAFIKNKPNIPASLADDNYTTDITTGTVSVINLPNAVIGPIQGLEFDVTHVHEGKDPGTLCWNSDDRTLNIQHPNDVVQQVGQESYVLVGNTTGSTITNGSCVRFAGAIQPNGQARLLVAPWLANGAFSSLYGLGILTESIANNGEGFVTVFGKVRDLDTTGTPVSETWAIGDILFAHPTIAGALTKVKPTAPNNCVPMAAVLRVDATEGEIFVRPTIEQQRIYGRFARTTDFTYGATNTAYALTFNVTEISNGVTIGTPTSRIVVNQSGFYTVEATVQLDTTSNKGVCYLWLRKNGTNVDDTTRREAIESSDDVRNFSYTMEISLNANDYIELCTAATSTDLRLDSAAATAFAPRTAGVLLSVTQATL